MTEQGNDSEVYVAKLHWILFFWPVALMFIGMGLGILFIHLKEVSLFLVIFSLAWGIVTWFTFHFSSLTIKKKQIILRTGVWVRQTIDIPLTKIETIDIRQSIIGSLFHYGALVITGTGGTRQFINYLDKPLTCRRYIEQLMHD